MHCERGCSRVTVGSHSAHSRVYSRVSVGACKNQAFCTFALLKDINERIDDYAVHEHVSLYFYEHPEIYNIFELIAPKRWREPSWRFQLDYPEDLEFQSIIHKELVPKYGLNFGIEEVVELLRNMPYLLDINKHCQEKPTR